MISYLTSADMSIIAFIGVIFAFALTCIAIAKLNKFYQRTSADSLLWTEAFSREAERSRYYLYIHICDIGSAFLTNQCGDCHLSCAYSY